MQQLKRYLCSFKCKPYKPLKLWFPKPRAHSSGLILQNPATVGIITTVLKTSAADLFAQKVRDKE